VSNPLVVDTMVFAYALLGVPAHRETALAVLEAADPIVVPDSCYAELANVVWQWTRAKEISRDTGQALLTDTEVLVSHFHPTTHLWSQALSLAIDADHPACDTLFIATAQREGTRVVTFDQRLQRAFPDWTLAPEAFLS
jgi:predicted nucleic acid-binding protein